MIDPHNITRFDRTHDELLEFLVFAIAVAGKNSDHVAPKVNQMVKHPYFFLLMENYPWSENGEWELIMWEILKKCKIGNYCRMSRALRQIAKADLDLFTCTIENLLEIYGIGPKSACFFLLHSRPNQELLVLDTHVRKFLKDKWNWHLKAISVKEKYLEVAAKAIQLIKTSYPHLSVAEADLAIWEEYRAT